MVCAIIPAAGIGSRMQSSIPKQYLPLGDGTVLLQSLRALLAVPQINVVMVALHPQDQWWPQTCAQLSAEQAARVLTCIGGDERWQSVQAALTALSTVVDTDTPVLVHDAVRPCVQKAEIQQLISVFESSKSRHQQGGIPGALLAMPVADTLKRADHCEQVESTVDRSHMWAACTPQMFVLADLNNALTRARQTRAVITDESSAVELLGAKPHLVRCSRDNIKITWPGDLEFANWILASRVSAS